MRLLDDGLKAPRVVEARRNAFEEFVKSKNNSSYPGTGTIDEALHNSGFSDYFAPLSYEQGMHHGLWIMPDGGDNSSVLIFPSQKEAKRYGDTLLSTLKRNGYSNSKVYVQQVAVHTSARTGYFGSLAPSESFDDKNRYILRIRARK